jgi:hypothetical protein
MKDKSNISDLKTLPYSLHISCVECIAGAAANNDKEQVHACISTDDIGGFRTAARGLAHHVVRRRRADNGRRGLRAVGKRPLSCLNPNPPDYERTPLFYQRPLTLYLVTVLKYEAGNKLTAQHIFMNAQAANVPAIFVR